jgi:hypothetical protein
MVVMLCDGGGEAAAEFFVAAAGKRFGAVATEQIFERGQSLQRHALSASFAAP